MLNKNEYLLDEILKAVDGFLENKSDDAVLSAIDGLEKSQIEIDKIFGELQDGIADVKIEMAELKTMLQQIINIVSKQTVDNVKNVDNSQINRTREPIGAYGDTTDEL